MRLLPKNLGSLSVVCPKESMRYATVGVRIKCGDDKYLAEATDGRLLARVEGEYPGGEYPPVPAIESAPNGQSDTIVPAKEWSAAFKAIRKTRGKPVLENAAIVQGNECTTFVSTDLESVSVTSPRNVEGRWPMTDEVFPRGEILATLRVDPVLLAKLLTLAATYADAESSAVDIVLYKPKTGTQVVAPVLVESSSSSQVFRGLCMPLSK